MTETTTKRCTRSDTDGKGCVKEDGHPSRCRVRPNPDVEFQAYLAEQAEAGPQEAPETVTVEPSRCQSCGSTEREKYFCTTTRAIAGSHDGQPYTHIVWRRTRCKACGQVRIDKSYEHRE
jgi:hypothetical protein